MSKVVLISIQPKWCDLIANGEKTVEVRKTRPKLETPFKGYIHCTKDKKIQFWTGPRYSYADDHSHNQFDRCGNGYIIGEFVCDRIFLIDYEQNGPFSEERGGGYSESYSAEGFHDCLSDEEFDSYLAGESGFGWHISDLKIYDQPKELSVFHRPCLNGLYCESCAVFQEHKQICGNSALQITRPPQSWCYVEGFE